MLLAVAYANTAPASRAPVVSCSRTGSPVRNVGSGVVVVVEADDPAADVGRLVAVAGIFAQVPLQISTQITPQHALTRMRLITQKIPRNLGKTLRPIFNGSHCS